MHTVTVTVSGSDTDILNLSSREAGDSDRDDDDDEDDDSFSLSSRPQVVSPSFSCRVTASGKADFNQFFLRSEYVRRCLFACAQW